MYRLIGLICLLSLVACDDGDAKGDAKAMDASVNQVPFDGEIMAPPDATVVDTRSFFPIFDGSEWRYRKKTTNWEMPPSVTEGAVIRVTGGEGENEFQRRTVAYFELGTGDEAKTVRQTIDEVFVIDPANMRVGPVVQIKSITVNEEDTADDSLIRRVAREYLPPYRLLADAWRTGMIDTRLVESVNLTETVTEPGMEEPRVNRGVVNVSIQTAIEPEVIPMEGQYREGVHKIEVADHFSQTVNRTYWVQRGVGVVQWRYQNTNNTTFTLMETNLESP